eukprot:TRINITY_DN9753_c0_g1_i1.p1 TRINITY_DN9753_c0_g1~~TRINITY_DN9753_c0_g1_i1.p1  ORF type:complete len:158 (+),score=27.98 TRINITY_DN9753_c0_g1_i1:17-490(+)
MVLYWLQIKATLENVSELKAVENCKWSVKYKCSNCGEETDKFVYCSITDQVANTRGKGTTNLIFKCKFCTRESYVDLVKPKKEGVYNGEDDFVTVMGFDCRGVSPEDFSFKETQWVCKSSSSETTFNPDLSEDWVDYDDEANCSVGIYEPESKFERD